MASVTREVHYREPLALELLRSFYQGKTLQELVSETGIPEHRIRMRVEAAERYFAAC